jgi:hypothetical protein
MPIVFRQAENAERHSHWPVGSMPEMQNSLCGFG